MWHTVKHKHILLCISAGRMSTWAPSRDRYNRTLTWSMTERMHTQRRCRSLFSFYPNHPTTYYPICVTAQNKKTREKDQKSYLVWGTHFDVREWRTEQERFVRKMSCLVSCLSCFVVILSCGCLVLSCEVGRLSDPFVKMPRSPEWKMPRKATFQKRMKVRSSSGTEPRYTKQEQYTNRSFRPC